MERQGVITPFVSEKTRAYGMTYGLSHAGYDIRLGQELTLQPFGFGLGVSLERFDMPLDLLAIVHDKSTLARSGVTVQNTVIEPGWHGFLTLELVNHTDRHHILRAGQPIAQIVFHLVDGPVIPYSGKYQDQPAEPVQAIYERERDDA